MKHLKAFEKWTNDFALTDKLRKNNDVTGVFDDETNYLDNDELYIFKTEEKDLLPELLKIKGILKEAGIDSWIEVLPLKAKEEVGQYHILVFEYDDQKLYSTGWYGDRCIAVLDYGHNNYIEYEIPLNVENYKTYVKDLDNSYDEFNKNLLEPEENNSNIDYNPHSKEQKRLISIQKFKRKILNKIAHENKLKKQRNDISRSKR